MLRALRGSIILSIFTSTLIAVLAVLIFATPSDAAINNQINFQGKITNPNGTNVTNGSYTFVFSVYTVPVAGTAVWTESKSLTVTDGIFQTALGDTTPLPGSVDFNNSSLYLGVRVGADAEMTPRVRLTSAPYAFNSGLLNGLASSNFTQLAQGLQVDTSNTNPSIAVNKTGSAGILQLQSSGTDVFSINNNGSATFSNRVDSPTAFQITNQIGTQLFVVDTSNNSVTIGSTTPDATGALLVVDTKNTVGDPAGSDGAIYYNSNLGKFRCYQNGFWIDCINGLGATSNSVGSFTSGLANVAANTAGQTVETLIFTSATAVSNTAGATGFVAPANGSFRTCLIKNNANITAGTLGLRWRVNGASVGASACYMDSSVALRRSSSSAIDSGVVNFSAGDTIGIAFDTSAGFAPTTTDYTVYWSVEYQSSSGNGITMQYVYDQSSAPGTIATSNNKDLNFNLSDTAVDSSFIVNLQCATCSGGGGRFAVQSNGTDVFTVSPNGGSTTFQNSINSTTGFRVNDSTGTTLLSVDTTNDEVIIGSTTTDATQVSLQLDSLNVYADSATCTTVNNQGALYYNTRSNAIRGCINGAWEDLVSTGALGLQLFGVVPDSGVATGDLASVTSAANIAGPCKVYRGGSATTVAWNACTAYSGGRKVIVAAGTATTTNGVATNFQHLCLTGANGQPALSTTGNEQANLATVSMPGAAIPILCLADIRFAAANNTITQIYDTRTYTTSDKIPVAINSTAGLGAIVIGIATKGTVQTTATANNNGIAGVVVASTGTASTTTVNGIIAVSGPAAVKAVTGTNAVNAYIFTSTTAGYATTVATKPAETTATIYNLLGSARTAWTGASACANNSDACAGSILTYIDKR